VFYGGIVLALTLLSSYFTVMPGTSYHGPLSEPSTDERLLVAALEAHVVALSESIGERRIGHADSMLRAKQHILQTVRSAPNVGAQQVRVEDVGADCFHAENVILEIPGRSADVVIVGAHYDSAVGAAGADDNASGVAATLEIARRLSGRRFQRTIRFVLFANEEPPYFQHAGMGSLTHAQASARRGDHIAAMLSLESLGYYSEAPGSQRYPWPIGLLYPDRADFVAFVGNVSSRALVREAIGTFRAAVSFPSEGAALPASIPGVGWSDHWSFWESGYLAVMVTDTAPYRNPNYHEPTDRRGTLDYRRLARVTIGLTQVVEHLATIAF
jgi:hypothetical protein